VGAKLKGLVRFLNELQNEKGALRPFVAVSGTVSL
jgi:hypothetical protein